MVPFLLIGYLRFFVTAWTSVSFQSQTHPDKKIQLSVISLTAIAIAGLAGFLIGAVFIHLSNGLHNSMVQRVARAPMSFFYSNPVGRIINRFSKDTAMTDSVIPFFLLQWI